MARKRQSETRSASVDLLSLVACVERFEGKRVVVFGDFVADSFQSGDITRVSREAPVLILRHRETHIVPGGAANAANNLAALGARVLPVSVVGDDFAGSTLADYFREKKVDLSGVLRLRGYQTPTKTRFLAGWAHTVGQQVLRVDYEPRVQLEDRHTRKIQSLLNSKLKSADALAISDYGFGVVTPERAKAALAHASRNIPVGLDSRYRLTGYARTGVTTATPNEAELEAAHHTVIGDDLRQLERCGRSTLKAMGLSSLVVTRGRHGMALFQAADQTLHLPVHGSDQAVDVTGAGDTVLAAYTLSLAAGASPFEAAHIANIAGGLVVMKRGTATVDRDELLRAIRDAASETNP
ncbi:MAG TPA: PfkB family carbohydrate kinase [Dongiaceae bacterium]|nr:PfkB family carbohydrate kinase [Dongiaceae bacterium]